MKATAPPGRAPAARGKVMVVFRREAFPFLGDQGVPAPLDEPLLPSDRGGRDVLRCCALTRATTPDRSRHGAPGTWVLRGPAAARRLLQPAQLSLVAGRAGRHPRPPRSANPADHVREPDRSDRGCAAYDPAYRLLQWSPPRRRGIRCRICRRAAVPPRYSRESCRNASTPTTTRHYT